MPADARACVAWWDALPGYVEACLRGADARRTHPGLYDHLARCEECSELVAETICALRRPEVILPAAAAQSAGTSFNECCMTGVSCRV
jgi:hypothetical protein